MGGTGRAVSRSEKPKHCNACLETELSEVLGRLKTKRNRKLVARHLGWDGWLPCSLQQAGSHFLLTRERARQIYADALPLLRLSGRTPALDAVLDFVRKHQHERASDVEQELHRRGFTNGRVSLQGVLRAAAVFGRTATFQLHPVGGTLFVGAVSQVGQTILNLAAKTVARHGAARVSDLCRQASRTLGPIAGKHLVRQVLQTRPDLLWLDESVDWFSLTGVPYNRVLTRVQKVLAVHPRIGVSKLHRAVSRDHKPVNIPETILRSLCTHVSWCRVGSRHIEASSVPDLEQLLSGAEAVICGILREHGGAMPLPLLRKVCLATGVKTPNLWRILSFSPLIQRFDKALYGLVGAEVAARQAVRIQRELAARWQVT